MEHRLPAVGYGDLLALCLADGGRCHLRLHRQATWLRRSDPELALISGLPFIRNDDVDINYM